MQERDRPDGRPSGRRPGEADIRGPTRGDRSAELPGRAGRTGFTDWDNPEDAQTGGRPAELEDAPEGFYDDEFDEEYELTPDDPDYDLSEQAGYSGWEEPRRRTGIPQWLIVALALLLILSILLPALLRFN